MRVAISQPRYLPALNYLQRILLVDVFVLLDTVQYTPRDWENRNRIRNWTGSQWLTVPVKSHTRGKLLRDTVIDGSSKWQKQHHRALMHSYRKAPFFEDLEELLNQTYLASHWDWLCDLDFHITQAVLRYLGRESKFVWASELGVIGRGGELILDLCRQLGATTYVSGSLGRNYLDASQFEEAKIELVFHDFDPFPYAQIHGEPFIAWLSAIDLFMNHGSSASLDFLMNGAALLPAR